MMAPSQGESLLAILDELSALLKQSRQMPMSASILVNKAEALDLLNAALTVVPEQVAEADEIVAGAKQVVDKADADAAAILKDAEERADRAIDQESVVAAAKQRAQEIIAAADAEAERLMADANAYCDRQLGQLEQELEQIGRQVIAGRRVIQSRREEHGA